MGDREPSLWLSVLCMERLWPLGEELLVVSEMGMGVEVLVEWEFE